MQLNSQRRVCHWCHMSPMDNKCSEFGMGGILEGGSSLGGLLGGGGLEWTLRYPLVLANTAFV